MGVQRVLIGFAVYALLVALLSRFQQNQQFKSHAVDKHKRTFGIDNDQFILNGHPIQLISGSIHYFRIHPAYWKDRLERCKALGLNTVEIYIPWNFHEEHPGEYVWSGWRNLEKFIQTCSDLDLLVQVRAGPYICAEWEFGGFPWWLASKEVAGGGTMKLRTNDPVYLEHVDRWWSQLLPRIRPHLIENGGPIVMLQIENEYGFCGSDVEYMRHLKATARRHLGDNVLLYTTDPANVAHNGTIPGDEVYTTVDFGPGWFDPEANYAVQKTLNAPGKSPPLCSEFYTGWLSHWGEAMANTSAEALATDTLILLEFANNTGSLNFYMAHGGTNFGFWAGANVGDDGSYQGHITSYDYDCLISEAGDYCQPGIGGECKYQLVRDVIARHTGTPAAPLPPPPRVNTYGKVELDRSALLIESLEALGSKPVFVDVPETMEQYGQGSGLILYRTFLSLPLSGTELDLGPDIHDYATVFLDGEEVGRVERGSPAVITLPSFDFAEKEKSKVQLDVLVEAMGRQNFGCANVNYGAWDLKGLLTETVKLGDTVLKDWKVFTLPLDDLSDLDFDEKGALKGTFGPVFKHGVLNIDTVTADDEDHLPDSYLNTAGCGKGVAWINGFNLGWYWPVRGPQITLYVPGAVLQPGENHLILLEVGGRECESVVFTDEADFYGPGDVRMPGTGTVTVA